MAGYKTYIQTIPDKRGFKTCYKLGLSFSQSITANFFPSKEYIPYNGKVYCVTVPSGVIITRFNNKTMIAGNCHAEFGCYLYQNYVHPDNKLKEEQVKQIMLDAMRIEKAFILESLPVDLIGMNAKEMSNYLESVADGLMISLGYSPVFGTKSPFPFMDTFGTNLRVNKFENNNPNYEIAESLSNAEFEMEIDDL